MRNFTVGPVQSDERIRAIGAEQVPYFRTPEFSAIMLENEKRMLKFSCAPQGARAVFLTGSGTASMEAVIMNTLTHEDRAIVVNGGSFGHRFVELLGIHDIPYTEIPLSVGQPLTEEMLEPLDGKGYTAFLVNVHETSTGVHYDMNLIGKFCRKNNLFLIVDAISSFLADTFDMTADGVDVMITGSQKALACPPGVSVIVLSPRALERVEHIDPHCMYFDLKLALKNGERGQTPFTPAVGILRQIHERLAEIEENGMEKEREKIAEGARYFREAIRDLPFEITSACMSNAVTPLHPKNANAYDVFTELKDKYGIWVCPNGGELKDKIFRVGHIGAIDKADYDTLIAALRDMQKRGKI